MLKPESTNTNLSAIDGDRVSPARERHYSVREVAATWQLSQDTIRRLFKNEPGVLVLSPRQRRGKRAYSTLRIPESVLQRVHKRCSLVR